MEISGDATSCSSIITEGNGRGCKLWFIDIIVTLANTSAAVS